MKMRKVAVGTALTAALAMATTLPSAAPKGASKAGLEDAAAGSRESKRLDRMVRKLSRRLNLDEAQRGTLEKALGAELEGARPELQRLRKEKRQIKRAAKLRALEKMRGVVTPEQGERLDVMLRKLKARTDK